MAGFEPLKVLTGRKATEGPALPAQLSFEYLKKGNSKLGPDVWTFSLPSVTTCPGRGACEKFCYALALEKRWPDVRKSYARNHEATKTVGWEDVIRREIIRKECKTVRLHVAGDFYSAPYIRGWIRIVKATPDVSYFAYTRSWNVPRLRAALKALRNEPNVSLYASVEPHEWDDASIKGWNKASVIPDFEKDKSHPGIVCPEAMWRHKTGSTRKGVPQGAVSCSTCRYCIQGKGNVQFPMH